MFLVSRLVPLKIKFSTNIDFENDVDAFTEIIDHFSSPFPMLVVLRVFRSEFFGRFLNIVFENVVIKKVQKNTQFSMPYFPSILVPSRITAIGTITYTLARCMGTIPQQDTSMSLNPIRPTSKGTEKPA